MYYIICCTPFRGAVCQIITHCHLPKTFISQHTFHRSARSFLLRLIFILYPWVTLGSLRKCRAAGGGDFYILPQHQGTISTTRPPTTTTTRPTTTHHRRRSSSRTSTNISRTNRIKILTTSISTTANAHRPFQCYRRWCWFCDSHLIVQLTLTNFFLFFLTVIIF